MSEVIEFCYRPLAWATDREAAIATFLHGGRIGFATGDLSRLLEELALVRPTNFSAPPTVWNKIYSEFKTALLLMTTSQQADTVTDEERLLEHFSKLIPTRCKEISIGGAMVSPILFNFMKRCFRHCVVIESYGTTECGGITYDNVPEMTVTYRLESVPEMSYTLDDKPFPRGELLVKTTQMFSGYVNNPEETRLALTEDGYFRTGDIVEVRIVEDGKSDIRVIDRKKNFFKLSQGQFVSPEYLQAIYVQSPFIQQIYIHGNPLDDCVVAVVVPNKEYVHAFAFKNYLTPFDMNNPNQLIYDAIMQDLRSIAAKEALQKHEIPTKLIIDYEPFTPENGLLTSSMKLCRPKLAAHYTDRLKATESIEDRLKSIIETVTGQQLATDENGHLMTIGGDSLAAVRLSRMIQNDLGVLVSLSMLFEPNMTLQRLAKLVKDPSQIAYFPESILSRLLHDSDQELNVTIGQRRNVNISPSMIFITGTTGFVGAFLLAEMLNMYPSHCKFVCLVRCKPLTNPLDRIRQNMIFLQLWKEEFRERIISLRGDLARDHLGLDNETYEALATKTDIIFHCGATVNFILSYSKLYGANVFGTREVIRLATHASTCIPVQYISTMSVLPPGVEHAARIDEISPNHLSSGYAQSKWVAEKLIAKASRSGLPVVVYRLGSICGDTETGACNQNDINTLLAAAIMKIGCYPTTAINTKFDGLPANFAAQIIVPLSRTQLDAYGRIYHIVNFNDGISFQNVLEGMHSCGIRIESVSYDKWRSKLMAKPMKNRSFEFIGEFFVDNPFIERSTLFSKLFSNNTSKLSFSSLDNNFIIKWLTFILHNIVNS